MGKYDLGYNEDVANRAINHAKGDASDQTTTCSGQFDGLTVTQGATQWGHRETGTLTFKNRYLEHLTQIKTDLDSLKENLGTFAAALQVCQNSLQETEGDIKAGQEALQQAITAPAPSGPGPFPRVGDPMYYQEV
ncbi:MAG: hypothetical protein Q4D96_14230 [Propionibacteriaceae bacterium]|nr:hypothetical protein [Propionibacteriaceae bacterium]